MIRDLESHRPLAVRLEDGTLLCPGCDKGEHDRHAEEVLADVGAGLKPYACECPGHE